MTAALLASGLVAAAAVFTAAAVREGDRRGTLERAGADAPHLVDDPRSDRPARLPDLVVAGVSLALGWVVFGAAGGLIGACLGAAGPSAVRRRAAARRMAALETQLADAVAAVAAGVRGGLSTLQAIATAAGRTPEPLAGSLRAVVEDTSLGSSLDDALDRWVSAIPVPDVRLAAAVLRLHRGTGGGFPVVLDGLGRTLRERRAALREVRSLTAQARLSGAILGLLPIGFFLFLWATSRSDMTAALATPAGRAAVVLGVALQGVAFLWIRRLLRVDA